MNKMFRNLALDYAAKLSSAESLEDVHWSVLAKELKIPLASVEEAIHSMSDEEKVSFWSEVIEKRIRSAHSSKIFQMDSWDKIGASVTRKLLNLLELGAVKDVGELLAIAKAAEVLSVPAANRYRDTGRAGNVSVNIGFGNSSAGVEGEEDMAGDLPGVGERMTIDLSPRAAKALTRVREKKGEDRIIDADKLEVDELRELGSGVSGKGVKESLEDFKDSLENMSKG